MGNSPYKTACAVYLLFFNKNLLLLQKRHNTGYMDGFYSLPSGHLEPGETIIDAAIREAFEETDLQITPQDLIPTHVLHRQSQDRPYIDFFFTVRQWEGVPIIKEPHKCDGLLWANPHHLPENTVPYIFHLLNQIEKGNIFSLHGWGS